jgi:hypothetical protein
MTTKNFPFTNHISVSNVVINLWWRWRMPPQHPLLMTLTPGKNGTDANSHVDKEILNVNNELKSSTFL